MDNKRFLLKISGTISSGKHREFEQTIRLAFNLLPSSCISSNLSRDVFRADMFYLSTLWRSHEDLAAFKHSNEYQLMKGSFQALGFLNISLEGELAEEQTFHVHEEL
jgi:hypothetical protein